jgi:hypothetical protein
MGRKRVVENSYVFKPGRAYEGDADTVWNCYTWPQLLCYQDAVLSCPVLISKKAAIVLKPRLFYSPVMPLHFSE